jgi:transposase
MNMEVVHLHCAGLDVHKKTVVATIIMPDGRGGVLKETRTFETLTSDLLAMSDWLISLRITHVAMESTGEYWKPIYNILENSFEVFLDNSQHIKQVPGRKTDIQDSEWIAELLRFGLLKASFIPPVGQRELRELTRHRTNFVCERATLVNRVQKTLESANIKLASIASSVVGISGRAILAAILAGQTDTTQMAELAKGRLRDKRDQLSKALEGRVRPYHQFVLTELLGQIDNLDEAIARFDEEIEKYCDPFKVEVELLDTIPGVARRNAEVIVAEIGIDMSRFPTADHLAAWAGVAPGNNESAGKRSSGKTRSGNQALQVALTQVANTASHVRNTYLAAQYHRLAARRGKKRAIVAVAHSILVISYHIIQRKEPYIDLGSDYFDKQCPEATAKRLMKRLQKLGYDVSQIQSPLAVSVPV